MEKKTIFIAEDDPDILNVMKIILKSAGYKVQAASRGKEILELDHARPDLVILDKKMPDMDGADVCRELRSRPDMHSVPVIMISASTDLRPRAAEAGVNEVLKKPFAMHTLLNIVHKYISEPVPSLKTVQKRRIFIVEDNIDILITLESILITAGYCVECSPRGSAVTDKKHEAADLYILDKKLPDMDGIDVCRFLRHNESTKRKPVIMITTDHGAKTLAKEVGVNSFLEKPFAFKDLLKEIERFLD
jgi:DNA-binding response OmpR family regulator